MSRALGSAYDWPLGIEEMEMKAHIEAAREAWREFVQGVAFRAFCLSKECGSGPGLPAPIAWLCALWGPLAFRFKSYNLERLFLPKRAERRQRLDDLSNYVFWCGVAEMTEAKWAEADALVREFGGDFPPRDWQPFSAAEAVGSIMGFSRDEVAEIVAKP